jgi:pimeloyl-ACP methyl ester carboxylesterase
MKLKAFLVMVFVANACQAPRRTFVATEPATVLVKGETLTFIDQGTGPPVLLLHGAVADHRMWELQREALATKYRVIALTMRYFGTAPWPDSGANFRQETHVADIAAFIRKLDAGPVFVVGHSYGSRTALALAVRHPELVRALFLNEPGLLSTVTNSSARDSAAKDRFGMDSVAVIAQTGTAQQVSRAWSAYVTGMPDSFDSLSATGKQMMVENARTVPLQLKPQTQIPLTCADLGQIRVPVAITMGERTRPFFRITVSAVSRCLPGSQLIVIERATHRAPTENPSAFNEALIAFLCRLTRRCR